MKNEDELTLADFGWAEGEYINICRDCNVSHIAAKLAPKCKKCAEKAMKEYKVVVKAPLICDYDEHTGKIQPR